MWDCNYNNSCISLYVVLGCFVEFSVVDHTEYLLRVGGGVGGGRTLASGNRFSYALLCSFVTVYFYTYRTNKQ